MGEATPVKVFPRLARVIAAIAIGYGAIEAGVIGYDLATDNTVAAAKSEINLVLFAGIGAAGYNSAHGPQADAIPLSEETDTEAA